MCTGFKNRVFNSRASASEAVSYGKQIEKLTPGRIEKFEILTVSTITDWLCSHKTAALLW